MKILFVCAIIASSYGYSVDFSSGLRETRSADADNDLKSKLTKLQSLLKDIRLEENILKASIDSKNDGQADRSETDKSKEPMPTKAELDMGDAPNMKIKKFVESMTPTDIQTLKELKQMLASARDRRPDDGAQFKDEIIDSSKEGANSYDWRDLARLLTSSKDIKEERSKEEPAKTEEGSFGAFRDEIKESVEKNLLSDIALAIHSGISFEEIIQDLTEPETAREDESWWRRRY